MNAQLHCRAERDAVDGRRCPLGRAPTVPSRPNFAESTAFLPLQKIRTQIVSEQLVLEEAERPQPETMPEMEMSGELRAPHLGLGD